MAGIKEYFLNDKISVALTIAIIVLGGIAYFGIEGFGNSAMMAGEKEGILQGLELKLVFNEKKEAKVFALAKNNSLAKFSALEGNSIPEEDSMVLGKKEAEILKEERVFSKAGDSIKGFFGINTKIEGILSETDTPADYLLFLSAGQFESIQNGSKKLFITLDSEKGDESVFYYRGLLEALPGNTKLGEGKDSDFEEHEIVGKTYYPIVLGFEEAKAMRAEGTFKNLGDTFEESGKNFIVVGVLEKNNSIFDIAHISPLNRKQLE